MNFSKMYGVTCQSPKGLNQYPIRTRENLVSGAHWHGFHEKWENGVDQLCVEVPPVRETNFLHLSEPATHRFDSLTREKRICLSFVKLYLFQNRPRVRVSLFSIHTLKIHIDLADYVFVIIITTKPVLIIITMNFAWDNESLIANSSIIK